MTHSVHSFVCVKIYNVQQYSIQLYTYDLGGRLDSDMKINFHIVALI